MNRHTAHATNAQNTGLTRATKSAHASPDRSETNGISLPLSLAAREALHREALALRRQAIQQAGDALGRALLAVVRRLRRGALFHPSRLGVLRGSR